MTVERDNATPPMQNMPPKNENSKNLTMIIYALQAASFVVGLTFLVAVVMNYIKQDDVRGSWLASHFRWQIRTFWFAILWAIIGGLLTLVFIGVVILFANAVWVIYRIAKGWIYLADNKPMYADKP